MLLQHFNNNTNHFKRHVTDVMHSFLQIPHIDGGEPVEAATGWFLKITYYVRQKMSIATSSDQKFSGV